MSYQEELARLQLEDRKKLEADRKKKEKEKKEADKEMVGCLVNCGWGIAGLCVLLVLLIFSKQIFGK
jgi:hypothetical protein